MPMPVELVGGSPYSTRHTPHLTLHPPHQGFPDMRDMREAAEMREARAFHLVPLGVWCEWKAFSEFEQHKLT